MTMNNDKGYTSRQEGKWVGKQASQVEGKQKIQQFDGQTDVEIDMKHEREQ